MGDTSLISGRPAHIRPGVLLIAATASAITGLTLVVFAPWRPPGFVSDSWYLLWRYGGAGADPLAGFVPMAGQWYRPLTDIGYWLTWNLFGLDPTGHFLLRLTLHVGTALLVAALALTLTHSRLAAMVSATALLFALPAHEVVWDHSALHLSLAAPAIVGAVLAYTLGRRRIALVVGVLALLIDEAGMLVLPLMVLCDLLFADRARGQRQRFQTMLRQLAPLAIALAIYLVARQLLGGGFYNEVDQPCRDARCVAIGGLEYLNRFAVRGEPLIDMLWTARYVIAGGVLVVLAVAAAVLRPWRWADARPALFGIGWATGASLFFIIALWPYVADRFLYIPQLGASLLLGAGAAEAQRAWPAAGTNRRVLTAAVGVLMVAWLGLGLLTVQQRGQQWVSAGERALDLAAAVREVVPQPEQGLIILIYGLPHSLAPPFPPGNTGPYVYLNGMTSAMRLLYGWHDVSIPPRAESLEPPDPSAPIVRPVLYLRAEGPHVTVLSGPPGPQ